MNNQTRNHLNLQKHIADQDHIIRVRNAEIAALRKRAEKAEKERDEARADLAEYVQAQALRTHPRPLTPDAIEVALRDCMPGVALYRLSGTQVMRLAEDMHAALTEPPARPEGAEKVEAVLHQYWSGDINGDDLADRIVEEMNR